MKKLKKERKKYTIDEILELTGCKIEEKKKETKSKKDLNNIILDENTIEKIKFNVEKECLKNKRQKIKPKKIYISKSKKKNYF